jgi:hypothetical protein
VSLKALGYDEREILLAEHLETFMTKAGAGMAGKWTTKPKGGKHEDGSIERRYTSAFQECPFLPSPESGEYFHAALGSFEKAPEQGWDMGGKPMPSIHKGGLLHHMGLDLPSGPSGQVSMAAYQKGLHALRRVVVELAGGVLAGRDSKGSWHDLGPGMAEAMALYCLQNCKVFPFLAPEWADKATNAHEQKAGLRLAHGIKEADEIRWETIPTTPQNTVGGVPLHILLAAAVEVRKITQDQAAKDLGVSPMTISRWIRAAKPISPESAARVRTWIEGEATNPLGHY